MKTDSDSSCNWGKCLVSRAGHVDYFRVARLNEAAGAADASRAMLLTSCRKVELLSAIFAFL